MRYQIILDGLSWEEFPWKSFCKYARRRYRYLNFPAQGVVEICDDSGRISEYEANIIAKGMLSEYMDDKFPLEQYFPIDHEKSVLPIETDVIADTYLFLSLKLAILQADARSSSVIDRYFLDIRVNYHPDYWHFYDFEEDLASLLDIKGITYQDIPVNGICNLVKEAIQGGTYIIMHLDEFYISRKVSYNHQHLVKENLIYGYDDEERGFYAFGFGRREQTESYFISYDEMVLSFEKGRFFYFSGAAYLSMAGFYPITLIDISCKDTFKLTESYLLSKMKDFLHPKERRISKDDIQVYGSDAYAWILEELEGRTDRETIDYRTFHLLYEHKKNVHRCIQKLGTMEEMEEDYREVVRGFNRLRIMYMKEAGMSERLMKTQKMYKIQDVNSKFVMQFKKEIEREERLCGL